MKLTENKKLRITLTVLLSVLLAAGVTLWCFAAFAKGESVLDAEESPKTEYTVETDEGLSVEVGPSESFGIVPLDVGQTEDFVVMVSWTAEGYSSDLVDVAEWEWSASWDEGYGNSDTDGGGSYSGNISEATDYGGDVWIGEDKDYYGYVSFGDDYDSATKFTDDPLVGSEGGTYSYSVGDLASDSVWQSFLVAYVYQPFGTPIDLTFTLWDYSGNDPLKASIRFDYMSYFTADSFTFYSGEEYDASDSKSEELFSASYDMTTGSFSDIEVKGSNASDSTISDMQELMTPSLDNIQKASNPSLWYVAEGAEWSIGTVSESSYKTESMSDWSIELSYDSKTYTDSADGNDLKGSVSWNTISNSILGTSGGIPEKTGGAVTKKNLQLFDKALNASAEAMIKVKFVYQSSTKFEFGLSFDEYGNLSVGIQSADTNVDGDIVFNGGNT